MLPSAGSQGSAQLCCSSSSSSPPPASPRKHHLVSVGRVQTAGSASPRCFPVLLTWRSGQKPALKYIYFVFLPSAVVLRYPAGRGLNEALLASRAILEQFRVCWVLVKDLLDIRYVGDGELVAHSEGKLIYFDVRHLFQQPLGISCFLSK